MLMRCSMKCLAHSNVMLMRCLMKCLVIKFVCAQMSQPQSSPSVEVADDRLSALPDDLVNHILSFLPDICEIARNSIISPRFRNLWIDNHSILFPSTFQDFASIEGYISCVDRCLDSHNLSGLLSLDLSLVDSRSPNPISADRWLRQVSTHSTSLSSLRLRGLSDLVRINIPCPGFPSLTHLELQSISVILPSNFPGFPSLTNLHLVFALIDDQTLSSLLYKCPSLRALTIRGCTQLTHLHLFSTKLHTLNAGGGKTLQVRIDDAPYLTSLKFRGNVNNLYSNNTPQLVDIDINGGGRGFANFDKWMSLVTCISNASNTKNLCVDNNWFCKFLFPRATSHAPLFRNLRMLSWTVGWVTVPALDGFASMLRHCSNLEHLNIDLRGNRPYVSLKKTHIEGQKTSASITAFEWFLEEEKKKQIWDPSNVKEENDTALILKTITVKCFLGTPNELKMLEYLLARASVLEKLSVQDSTKEISLLLASIPRASSHMQIFEV